ncbi:hypothetical protein [Nocardia caishijiensis]|uniref:Uncharacterized protein n=1 Tax=Nocardia caishijiensis TaxID=184756 RepID=A0ABQ6YKK2_9NOCA|nr:hypothetical protein [Nocardia caishijiensis]KAF0846034.1 hypothetical protein FNL39_106429 [Nocardia caishijiensis]
MVVGAEKGSLRESRRAVRVRVRRPLRVTELVTGAMVLLAAGGGMTGPVVAAVLEYRAGAPQVGTAVTASLVVAIAAVVVCLVTGAWLLATAWRRRAPRPAPDTTTVRVRVPTGLRPRMGMPGLAVRGAR